MLVPLAGQADGASARPGTACSALDGVALTVPCCHADRQCWNTSCCALGLRMAMTGTVTVVLALLAYSTGAFKVFDCVQMARIRMVSAGAAALNVTASQVGATGALQCKVAWGWSASAWQFGHATALSWQANQQRQHAPDFLNGSHRAGAVVACILLDIFSANSRLCIWLPHPAPSHSTSVTMSVAFAQQRASASCAAQGQRAAVAPRAAFSSKPVAQLSQVRPS